MVSIEKKDGVYHLNILRWHKLWCLKSKIRIAEKNIRSVSRYNGSFTAMGGIRLPGTYIPGLITAGSYYTQEGWVFCDIMSPGKCLEIHLQNEKYSKLIIQVEDIESCLRLFTDLSCRESDIRNGTVSPTLSPKNNQ
jgi:hypothetical protein